VTVLLALAALFLWSRWRTTVPFLVLALIGFEAAFGLEPVRSILLHAPALSNDRNARLSILIQLGTAVLAAIALDALLKKPATRVSLLVVSVGAALVVAGGLLATHASFQDLRTALHHFRTGDDFARADVIELVSVGWWTALALLLLAAMLARRAIGATAFAVVVLAIAAFDYGHFARGYNPMAPSDRAVPAEPAAVRFLAAHTSGERVVGIGTVLPPDTSMQYRLKDVRGNDPPFPDKRFFRFFRLINPSQPAEDWLAVPRLTTRARKMLNLLNARYVVTAPGSPRIEAPGLHLSYTGGDADVYRDDRALPRAFIPRVVRSVGTDDDVFAQLAAAGFQPSAEAIVRGSIGVRGGAGTVVVRRDRPTEIELNARLRRRSLVVLTNVHHPGWRVSVDGKSRPPVQVDGVLQGVVVPRGSHTIRWTYQTPELVEGVILSATAAAGVLVWMLVIGVRRYRADRRGRP
jgi:hypothetical protein